MKRELLGVVGVDSGQLLVVDPSYIPLLPNYDALCKGPEQLKFALGHDGLGVKFSPGFGDGTYEVWAEYENYPPSGCRIKKVEIICIE